MKSKLRFASLLSGGILLASSSARAVTYYWDNLAGAGFGAAGGTWASLTANQWSTSNSGADSGLQASVTTTNADSLNFGTATVGLGAGTITVSGTVATDTLTFGAASGNITLSGGVIDATSGSNLAITVNSAQATISSNIIGTPGANTRGINKAGSGMLILSGDNSAYIAGSYTRTTIAAGVLRIDNALSLPPGLVTLSGGILGLTTATGDFSRAVAYAPNAGTSVQFGTTAGGGFAAYGGDRSVTLNGGGTVQFGVSNNGILGPLKLSHSTADSKVTLTSGLDLNGGAAGVLTRVIEAGDGSATIDGKISGVISDTGTTKAILQKTGAGTLELSNTNTYDGPTEVLDGKLLINGSTSSTSLVTVASTGTLGGTGTVGGATTIDGTLSPGNSPGTLTFGSDLTLNSGATLALEAGDLTAVNGTLTLNDNWIFSLGLGFQDGGSVTIFTYNTLAGTSDLTPVFDIANLGFTPSGALSLTDTGTGSIVLNGVSVVPEPRAALLGGLGLLMLLRRRRTA